MEWYQILLLAINSLLIGINLHSSIKDKNINGIGGWINAAVWMIAFFLISYLN